MKFSTWTPSLLGRIVDFWNRSFASRRNFFPLTPDLFHQRVLRRGSGPERFRPSRFIVAQEGQDIAGFIHVGERPESLCRALDPQWRSGTQGYVAFLFVDPARRRKGLGTDLWHRGLDRLKSSRQVVLDGQCFNPYYGNSEGPFTPFWGTPEGVSVDWNDSATKKFLARKGFAPRFKGVQLSLALAEVAASVEDAEKALARQGMALQVQPQSYPELGKAEGKRRPMPEGLDYEVVGAVRRGKVAGLIAYYPMREVRPGLFGIYEAVVLPQWRGKSLGRKLLEAATARMKALGGGSCEVLTLPELSPAAHKLYAAAGFQPVQNWAIY
ncbi:MAG TPA: GNAT family N-acetyltransferase [Planctomycetota bacterium]|nr:GNAT family N-acetyltransferase [Planctomycetota bacterium]